MQASPRALEALESWRTKAMTMAGNILPETEGACSLLDARHGGRGRAVVHCAIVDALRLRLETEIPKLGYDERISLLETSWAFSRLPEFRPVLTVLLETWPGNLPANLARALHKWPEDVFLKLPRLVRWKSWLCPDRIYAFIGLL